MRYFYTIILASYLSYTPVQAQDNGGFFGKITERFSGEVKIGSYTFKDGSVYTGELKSRKPHGKGKTII